QSEFLSQHYYHLRAAGYNYVYPYHKSVGYQKRIGEVKLYNLNPDFIDFERIETSIFDLESVKFKYRHQFESDNSKTKLITDDVIIYYDTKPNSKNPFKGHSRLTSLKDEANNTLLANRGKRNQIKRTGATIVSHKERPEGLSDGLDEEMTRDKQGNPITFKDDIENKLNGSGLAQGKSILVSSKELKVDSLAKDITGIDFDKMKQSDMRVIANKIGVPNELNPFENDNAKYENREQAQFSVIQNEIEPVANSFALGVMSWFDNHPNKIILDYSHLPAYQV